jgi:hypothetical protein
VIECGIILEVELDFPLFPAVQLDPYRRLINFQHGAERTVFHTEFILKSRLRIIHQCPSSDFRIA